MTRTRFLPWFLPLVLACAAPADQDTSAAAVDTAAVMTAVTDFWPRYIAADTSNDPVAIAGMFTEDGRVDARGIPVLDGRAAIQSFLETALKSMRYTSLAVMPDMTVPVSNELVYQNGSYVENMVVEGRPATEHGRYAMALRKDGDGQWRVMHLFAFADSTIHARR